MPTHTSESSDSEEQFNKISRFQGGSEYDRHLELWCSRSNLDGKLRLHKTSILPNQNSKSKKPKPEVVRVQMLIDTHPHILELQDWFFDKNERLNEIYDWCEGRMLLDILPHPFEEGGQPERLIWKVFIQVADALAWLRTFNLQNTISLKLCRGSWKLRRSHANHRFVLRLGLCFTGKYKDRRLGSNFKRPDQAEQHYVLARILW